MAVRYQTVLRKVTALLLALHTYLSFEKSALRIMAFKSFAVIQLFSPRMLTSLQVLQYSRQCGTGSLVFANLTRLISFNSSPQGQGSTGRMLFMYGVGSCMPTTNSQRSSMSFGMSLIQILTRFVQV